jgi:hypothetical protein
MAAARPAPADRFDEHAGRYQRRHDRRRFPLIAGDRFIGVTSGRRHPPANTDWQRCLCALLAAAVMCAPALSVVAQDASITPTPAAAPGETLTFPAAAAGPSAEDDNSILVIGTATVLIRYGDMTILTTRTFCTNGDPSNRFSWQATGHHCHLEFDWVIRPPLSATCSADRPRPFSS